MGTWCGPDDPGNSHEPRLGGNWRPCSLRRPEPGDFPAVKPNRKQRKNWRQDEQRSLAGIRPGHR